MCLFLKMLATYERYSSYNSTIPPHFCALNMQEITHLLEIRKLKANVKTQSSGWSSDLHPSKKTAVTTRIPCQPGYFLMNHGAYRSFQGIGTGHVIKATSFKSSFIQDALRVSSNVHPPTVLPPSRPNQSTRSWHRHLKRERVAVAEKEHARVALEKSVREYLATRPSLPSPKKSHVF